MSLINVTNLTFAYDGSYENIFENVSFQLDTNWRLGFTGRNGLGKTTFLILLLGKYEKATEAEMLPRYSYFHSKRFRKVVLPRPLRPVKPSRQLVSS